MAKFFIGMSVLSIGESESMNKTLPDSPMKPHLQERQLRTDVVALMKRSEIKEIHVKNFGLQHYHYDYYC